MKKSILTLITAHAIAIGAAQACGSYGDLDEFWLKTLNGPEAEIETHTKALRDLGQAGLDSALGVSKEVKAHPKYPGFVDQIAKQRDAINSGLFWHTNFDKALAQSKETNRPILSLRLLGNLDDEFSCANSRLFREVLYPDNDVKKFLRDNFVLHWKSVRPVPVMTIDFGDGRTLKRTITGNSAHYILDQRGRVVDSLPGLYTPEKFLRHLKSGQEFAAAHGEECSRLQPASLTTYHKRALADLEARFNAALEEKDLEEVSARLSDPIRMEDLTADEWALIAEAGAPDPVEAAAAIANKITRGKMLMETPLIEVVEKANADELRRKNLDEAAVLDSVRNEFALHRRIHQEIVSHRGRLDIDTLNKWVYAELFLMPDSDPWLGLNTPDVFTGLKDNGIVSQ